MSPYPPKITYRELTIKDYEDLKEYVGISLNGSFTEEIGWRCSGMGSNCLPIPYPESYWLSIAADKKAHYSLGAYGPKGQLIGAIGVVRSVKDFFMMKCLHKDEQELISLFKKVCYITTLIVASEFRKIGVATQLIHRASTVLLQEGSQLIYLHVLHTNYPAIRLYEKMGYNKVADIPNYYKIEGKEETGIIYCRRLAKPICDECLPALSCSIL